MKKIVTLLVSGMLALTLCSFSLSEWTSKALDIASATVSAGASEATSVGQKCGNAVKNLYNQYKADGKLNMKNISNITALATLATNVTEIKENIKNADFYKDLANGLIAGSQNIINKENVEQVVSNLTNTDLSALSSIATSAKSEVKQATTDITSILELLKQAKAE
jgi:endonuclease III-like uncharacterized protein